MMPSTDPSKSGFTLLETLIAFTVFSLFLIAVHKSFVTSVKGEARADWSNEIGQAVRSEFALIEAGQVPGPVYRKEILDHYILEVRIVDAPNVGGGVSMHTGNLQLARLKVHDGAGKVSVELQKLLSPGAD